MLLTLAALGAHSRRAAAQAVAPPPSAQPAPTAPPSAAAPAPAPPAAPGAAPATNQAPTAAQQPPTTAPVPAPKAAAPAAPIPIVTPAASPTPRVNSDGSRSVRCTAHCDRAFEAGVYRVLIDPTENVAGGMTRVTIPTPGAYRVEGVRRSRRAGGMLLASTGIVLTALGAGMALGGGAFDSHLSASEERWFWGGLLTFSAGATFIPLGFMVYSRSPRVHALQPQALERADSNSELPRRYREPVVGDDEVVPPGRRVVHEPRWGLISAGAITLASSYGIMAAIAAGHAASDNDEYSALFIPVLGPTIVDRRERGDAGWTIFGTMPQLAGGIMMLLGATTSRRVVVESDTLALTPVIGKNVNGLALSGSF
ncbi:MAG: hypothetical protein ACOY0T_25755 [Myxococcota bacterium]